MLTVLLFTLPLFAEDEAARVRTLLKQDRVTEAEAAVRKLNTSDAEFSTITGELQFRRGLFDDAQKSFERAVRSARSLLGMGRLHESLSHHRTAAGFFRRAYALDPNDPDVIKEWAGTLANHTKEIAALKRYLSKATGEDPERLLDVRNRIEFLMAMGDRPGARLSDPPETAQIRLSLIESSARSGPRGFGIAVSMNGGRPTTLLFDTGADGITIHRKLAAKFGIKPMAASRLRGLGDYGAKDASIGIADELRIGDIVFKDVPVRISDQKTAGTDEGLVGSDLFQSFLVSIDGPRRVLQLKLRPECDPEYDAITPEGEEDFTRVRTFNHLMLVDTQAAGKKRGWFLIDSGASSNMVSIALARSASVYVGPGSLQLTGVSGRIDRSYIARNLELFFGGLRTPNPEMMAFDFQKLNKSVRTEISGLLGFPTVETMVTTIDYRNGLVKFQKGK
jgi:predicted aspartyl protease